MPTHSSTLSRPQNSEASPRSRSELSPSPSLKGNPMKSPYNIDQQVKFLHLQAEVDTLLLQLQTLKQKRMTATFSEPAAANSVRIGHS
ncbi:MAG: hypothetical protein ACP5D7_09885 [Limnospira sp.]